MIKYVLRPCEEGDLNFIYNSWLKSYRGSDFAKNIPNDIYYNNHKETLERYLNHSSIMVACNPDNPHQVFGYCVATQDPVIILHYVYVKYSYRKLGIGKALVKSLIPSFGQHPVICTHSNYYWKEHSNVNQLVFNPYI